MLGMEVRFLFAALECLLSIKVYYKGFVNLRYQFDSVRRLYWKFTDLEDLKE